ncbi:hypothetical protein HOY82DRAFT_600137 [Tuber indicum]|nr:hypothetical protein HOY82DRAFT_600137 [Tuber indicum]
MEVSSVVLGAFGLVGGIYRRLKRCGRLMSDMKDFYDDFLVYKIAFVVEKTTFQEICTQALSLTDIERNLAIVMLDDKDYT